MRCGDTNKLQTPFGSISLQTVLADRRASALLEPGRCLVGSLFGMGQFSYGSAYDRLFISWN
jgi:hypothetical protein